MQLPAPTIRMAWLLLALLVTTTVTARADSEKAGTLIAARGTITAKAKDKRTLQVKDPVFAAEVIQTASRTKGQILFADNSVLGLGPNSQVIIRDYLYDPKAKDGKLTVEVKQGAFRVLGGALSKGKEWRVKVQTRVATCGIRGSLFSGVYDPKTNSLFIMLLNGEMMFEIDGVVTVVDKPMMGVVIQNGKIIRGPAIMKGAAQQGIFQAGDKQRNATDDSVFKAKELVELFDNHLANNQDTMDQLQDGQDGTEKDVVSPPPPPPPPPAPPRSPDNGPTYP